LLGAATVVGGTGVRSLGGDWPIWYGLAAAGAVIVAAVAVYCAHKAGASEIVDSVPPGAQERLDLENESFKKSKHRLLVSKVFSVLALGGFLVAIGFLWYAPAIPSPTQSAPVTTAWVRSR
jgi:hypothetical protein